VVYKTFYACTCSAVVRFTGSLHFKFSCNNSVSEACAGQGRVVVNLIGQSSLYFGPKCQGHRRPNCGGQTLLYGKKKEKKQLDINHAQEGICEDEGITYQVSYQIL
jgi:hypothetical protein